MVVFIVFVVCLTPLTFQEPLYVTSVMKDYDPLLGLLAFLHALLNPLVHEFVYEQGIQESSEKSV